ncbi:MAG: phosphoribosylamine--glycine ligase [Acetobacteraceae bacterium]|nr:phosphoribosylamine--glycine ligase [Acetobacteraceae bacterium]
MRVLVVGGGGREHALCWKLARSPMLSKLWCAPGNPGTAMCAENVAIDTLDIAGLVAFARDNAIDLVLPGGEPPLVAGIADAMDAAGIACCGPSTAAAQLEGSKTFTKEICDAAKIPTASWRRFTDARAARDHVRQQGAPIVIKADGLAAGKGVVVAASVAEAEAAIGDFMEAGTLGASGRTLVIEECLTGPEISLFALCDGVSAVFLGAAQDHKRVGDGDIGPNTGGMGAYSPPPMFDRAMAASAMDVFIRPTLAEMNRRGTPFRGILFAGLMLTPTGPKLIEFNVRFGDPECQVLMLRLKSDLLGALVAACDGELAAFDLRWDDAPAVGVVMAARGYPGVHVRDTAIDLGDAETVSGVQIFHAGTALKDGALVNSGGRVLTVCAQANDIRLARETAYTAVDAIHWPDGFCRRDIGWRALA